MAIISQQIAWLHHNGLCTVLKLYVFLVSVEEVIKIIIIIIIIIIQTFVRHTLSAGLWSGLSVYLSALAG